MRPQLSLLDLAPKERQSLSQGVPHDSVIFFVPWWFVFLVSSWSTLPTQVDLLELLQFLLEALDLILAIFPAGLQFRKGTDLC